MTRHIATLMLGLLAATACGRGNKPDAGAGGGEMTAEEHARMLMEDAGGGDTVAAQRSPVHLNADQIRAIGVRFTEVQLGPLVRIVRTVGQVVPAEPNLAEVTTKIDGFVDELFVAATGVMVRRGQRLLTLYSPMLVAAQEELLAARRLAAAVDSTDSEARRNSEALVDASRRRLSYWDISSDQIDRLERTGEATKTLVLNAPVDGVVLEKMVVAGQAVMPGMKLYRIADLSTVWVEGAVFEQDLAVVRLGAVVHAQLAAYPGRTFEGRISFVWPTVDEASRSLRVRVAFRNRGGILKPGMYATLLIDVPAGRDVLSVPADAVVMTGARNLVFVVTGEGTFVPREVVLGTQAGDRVEIVRGLGAGDRVVSSANFLVDAESRLSGGAAMPAMPGMPDHKP